MNTKYFIALTGAKKNVGDFLITDRAIALLRNIAPEYEFIIKPHWEKLDDIELVNNSEGVIILGGPGFQMNMYPDVYKLVKDLKNIKVPIHTLGVGWKGVPGDKTTEKLYQFTSSAKQMLDKMNDTFAGMSCRDHQTERTLRNNGYKNVTMTGCPVWYDLDSIGKEFVAPKEIKRIVYTPAQDEAFSDQSIEVLKFLKNRYSASDIIVSFHRGIGEVDQYTPENDARNTAKLEDAAKKMGLQVADVSFDATKLSFYDECDLHIGYRVHAHIYFLSKRLPSILLHEDGRGNGVSEALNSPGIDAYRPSEIYSEIFGKFNKNARLLSLYNRLALKVNKNITADLNDLITELEDTNYNRFKGISKYIDQHYKVMEKFIKNVINKNGG
ncbi:polysaccharide pyruvyl transferase family protein [Halobacillus amylolyticus]|uniref:Polysaccharide pyruvyl transferase family protein n=1 Tax=Halobacillus amylolyticus TaxID=2932259 RepID=A0ABY4H941_9BACI|nr:polysaccharide pyruvyl transferase family protein [Halobacillus amylolyticus]UOR11317.1 polysaccharide pyruvyl transferase family protein [Halobacillus amylolyticus]